MMGPGGPSANPSMAGAMHTDLIPFVEAERDFVQLQSNGEHEAAVRCLENVLRAEQHVVQEMRDSLLSTLFERLGVGYNTLGMKYLKDGNTDVSLKFFEKAEALSDPANLHMTPQSRLVLRAVTYNNMGCFYKSMSKLHTSLQYLRKAQSVEERLGEQCQNPAGTHLNLCALLSQMGKHAEALQHSQRALELLQNVSPSSSDAQGESLIAVAYFNMGAEYEHLRKRKEALWAYSRAHENCLAELGEQHALTNQVKLCVQQLRSEGPHARK